MAITAQKEGIVAFDGNFYELAPGLRAPSIARTANRRALVLNYAYS